ncbi:MAG: thiol:disulfide interchange protein DsbA/DsbL [Burkholderiaceae bacterium]
MKRREFSVAAASALAAGTLALPAHAQGKPEEGTHYLALDKRVPTEAPAGKIEVVEFFWYSCPHCNAFEPKLEAWIKRVPPDVVVRRVPVAFRENFVPQQRLFYSLEALGKLEEMHRKVFAAIHGGGEKLDTQESILAWVEKQGIDKAKFLEQYNSFSVSSKARKAAQLQQGFGVQGVPALGIAGRWYTDGTVAGNMDRALLVADYLLAEARKSK